MTRPGATSSQLTVGSPNESQGEREKEEGSLQTPASMEEQCLLLLIALLFFISIDFLLILLIRMTGFRLFVE